MAYYKPDHKLQKANDLIKFTKGEIEELPRSMKNITQDEKDELILYKLKSNDNYTQTLQDRINEYPGVFNAMGKFMPYKGPPVYG